jgi:hypothetical protein
MKYQPKLVKYLKDNFGVLVESLEEFQLPAPPRSIVKCPGKEDILILLEQKTLLRYGIGMLLYLVNHSIFEIAISVRELSKESDAKTMVHGKLILRSVKFKFLLSIWHYS